MHVGDTSKTVDVTPLLDKPDGSLWHVHRKFRFECFQPGSSAEDLRRVELIGTFRHNACSFLYENNDLTDGNCYLCASAPRYADFRGRVRRLASRGVASLGASTSNNDRHMGKHEVRGKLSAMKTVVHRQRRELQWRAFKIAYLRSRVKTLKEKINESVVRGDVRKVIDDLKFCAAGVKFERKQVLLNFIKDAVNSVRHNGHGIHYHEPTHRTSEMLKHYGGPRSNRLLQANLFGPHLRTTEKRYVPTDVATTSASVTLCVCGESCTIW